MGKMVKARQLQRGPEELKQCHACPHLNSSPFPCLSFFVTGWEFSPSSG